MINVDIINFVKGTPNVEAQQAFIPENGEPGCHLVYADFVTDPWPRGPMSPCNYCVSAAIIMKGSPVPAVAVCNLGRTVHVADESAPNDCNGQACSHVSLLQSLLLAPAKYVLLLPRLIWAEACYTV